MKGLKLKKILGAFVVSACLMATAAPVLAETVNFDITVPGDILSKRAVKKDWEQKFYVTGTSFNKNGTLFCTSIKRSDSSVRSKEASISPGKLSANASYTKLASPGEYYYMTTYSFTNNLHVLGRYTP